MRRRVPDRGLVLASVRIMVVDEVQAQAGAHRWHGGARDPAGIAHPELHHTGGSQRPRGEGAGTVIEQQRARKRLGCHCGHHAAHGEGHQQFGQQRTAPATARGAPDVASDAGRGDAGTGSSAQGKRHGPTVAPEPCGAVTAALRPWSWHRVVRRHPLAAAPRGPGGTTTKGDPLPWVPRVSPRPRGPQDGRTTATARHWCQTTCSWLRPGHLPPFRWGCWCRSRSRTPHQRPGRGWPGPAILSRRPG